MTFTYDNAESSPLVFTNGVFDPRDGSFRPRAEADALGVVRDDLPYELPLHADPTIQDEINTFLSEVIPDQELREFLLLTMALPLEGFNRHRLILIWMGLGLNGKSTLADLLKVAYNNCLRWPAFNIFSSCASKTNRELEFGILRDSRLVLYTERHANVKLDIATVEAVVHGEPMKARTFWERTCTFAPHFIPVILTNTLPFFDDDKDDNCRSRNLLTIIPFSTRFRTHPTDRPGERLADGHLRSKLRAWGPQFMLMLIDVYHRYLEAGRELHIPHKVMAFKQL